MNETLTRDPNDMIMGPFMVRCFNAGAALLKAKLGLSSDELLGSKFVFAANTEAWGQANEELMKLWEVKPRNGLARIEYFQIPVIQVDELDSGLELMDIKDFEKRFPHLMKNV